ncbi:hypothetical protein T492DRAFT_1147620 [Pavlovales sp. CCMP2436]|nr:hypothetical protein T492DRAFT_1147620 [Pavlovales sp. CCMP2436]
MDQVAQLSAFPGKYLEGGKAAGGQLVDQRLLPRISEGEVRMLMVGDILQCIIHKKPESGGLSAVGGQAAYTYFKPGCFIGQDLPSLKKALGIDNEPLPLLWTADFIPNLNDFPEPLPLLWTADFIPECALGVLFL